MEPSKRRLLSGIAALTAGAALIPVTQVQAQSVPAPRNGRAAISRGDGRKRYGMLIDLRLFRLPGFSAALALNVLALFIAFGFLVLVAQYLQLVRGMGPVEAPY